MTTNNEPVNSYEQSLIELLETASTKIAPRGELPLFTELPRETVWKIRMASTLGIQEPVKRGEKHPYCRKAAPTTRDLDPSSYFPNSFRRLILGNWVSGNGHSRKPGRMVTVRLFNELPRKGIL